MIVLEQAEIVKEIFAEALAGKGTHTIATALNKRGIPSKKGGRWYAETVARLIGNEKYTGDALFQKTYTDSSFNRHVNYGEQDMYLVKEHHEAIITHEDFQKANAVLKQRGKEKGIEKQSTKYQNRYAFSGRIKCAECGSSFKRRIRYQTKGTYVVWCCSNHIKNIRECSMEYIADETVKKAFVTMMNKLVFGHQTVLKPLLKNLQSMKDKDKFFEIQELESRIGKNTEQRQVLTSLMASKYLEPVLFNKENNRLTTEMEMLRKEKDSLMRSIGGDRTKAEELQKLIKFTAKGEMLTHFDDEVFLNYVEKIKVLSRTDIAFELKCRLELKERLVE